MKKQIIRWIHRTFPQMRCVKEIKEVRIHWRNELETETSWAKTARTPIPYAAVESYCPICDAGGVMICRTVEINEVLK